MQCLGSLSLDRPTSQRVFSSSNVSTGRLPPSVGTSRVSWRSAATWNLWSSRGLMPRRRRFSGSRPTDHRALYRMVRQLHLAGERSTGPTSRQHQLGDADSRVLPIALFSRFSIRGFPVSVRIHLDCVLGSATMTNGATGILGSALGERKGWPWRRLVFRFFPVGWTCGILA